ncbi:uncharacterized protein LOC111369963 isoform X2 [Olea europaea var. sylvestris]|uniref:RING-type domain-containing protein n=1 Tax=Olea europaea subsp. europaea TaxID=158383 RepID=A0A8S0S4S5_OLEEU|nr:uncharacterized protein LOC111369963 isoform X2 [Olea europaea var. sylvestris]CAA2986723.1 Hypothetical predicted protein [Olea europaea subsp. europaea]
MVFEISRSRMSFSLYSFLIFNALFWVFQSEVKGDCTAALEEIHLVGYETNNINSTNHHGVCAICLDEVALQETALTKGCKHAYCVHNDMIEESVCLLLGASWFKPLIVVDLEEVHVDVNVEDYYYYYEDEEEDLDNVYYGSSSSLRIGNWRWGDNGYVRGGWQEARPMHRPNFQDTGAGPSRQPKKKETAKEMVGRRAKRELKWEAADKAAAAKHERHFMRLGHKSG